MIGGTSVGLAIGEINVERAAASVGHRSFTLPCNKSSTKTKVHKAKAPATCQRQRHLSVPAFLLPKDYQLLPSKSST